MKYGSCHEPTFYRMSRAGFEGCSVAMSSCLALNTFFIKKIHETTSLIMESEELKPDQKTGLEMACGFKLSPGWIGLRLEFSI